MTERLRTDFCRVQSRIRIKHNHERYIQELNQRCYFDKKNIEIEVPLILTTTNDRADALNVERLKTINSESHFYMAKISGKISKDIQKTIPTKLELKVGAQVMVTRNISGAANGTLGIVKKLLDDKVVIETLGDKRTIECPEEIWEQYAYEWHNSVKKITSHKWLAISLFAFLGLPKLLIYSFRITNEFLAKHLRRVNIGRFHSGLVGLSPFTKAKG